ncbi:unnamed protein product [Adineta ricciae]|uniref:non-specific serine/threonine protein kinase n=1 Tax=Adineta ricciae TaxID=249248 RepID=A0A814SMZ7_ADIRI|nr:unnamed protein product [Adineta ricciae]
MAEKRSKKSKDRKISKRDEEAEEAMHDVFEPLSEALLQELKPPIVQLQQNTNVFQLPPPPPIEQLQQNTNVSKPSSRPPIEQLQQNTKVSKLPPRLPMERNASKMRVPMEKSKDSYHVQSDLLEILQTENNPNEHVGLFSSPVSTKKSARLFSDDDDDIFLGEKERQNLIPTPILPPISRTCNLNDIFRDSSLSPSIKAFKDACSEYARACGKLECYGNVLLTDVHLYELSQLEWPLLDKIQVRACPHITPFGLSYLRKINEKHDLRSVQFNVDLLIHDRQMIEIDMNSTTATITKLEDFFKQSVKTSISKVLIYHTTSLPNSTLSPDKMIINQIQKVKESSPMTISYLLTTSGQCQIAYLECVNSILFKELSTSFHPQIVYLVVSNTDDLLKCLFSIDCDLSFSILNHQLRLIIDNHESVDHFLSDLHSKLKSISKSAHELYTHHVYNDNPNVSENDDYRRNHFLSSLLHTQTKCDLLTKKLTKDQCLLSKQKDSSFLPNHMAKDAVKHCDTLYTFSFEKMPNETVVKTSESVNTFINQLTKEAKGKREEEVLPSSMKLAKIYFQHKLITDTVLDIHSTSSGESYYVSNMEWFCQMLNKLLNIQSRPHRKTEQVFDQIKSTIGSDVHLLTKYDFKNFQINRDETNFFQWLFNTWNIGFSINTNDQQMFLLSNSIASKPPVPLSTVWPETWEEDDREFVIHFRLLHPCDAAILFEFYKLLPSQKLLLASRDFLLILEGAVEILVQYQHEIDRGTDIRVTFRTLDLLPKDASDLSSSFVQESFEYLIREYYVIIWAYLFKLDYAFKVRTGNAKTSDSLETIVGNEIMTSKWHHLALYHYSPAPTLSTACSVCGLRPAANKSLYRACATLSPARHTTTQTESETDPSGFVVLDIERKQATFRSTKGDQFDASSLSTTFSYTGKQCLTPEGCNSFEVVFVSTDDATPVSPVALFSLMEIGCLINNSQIKEDEKILFEYGLNVNTSVEKSERNAQKQEPMSFLDEIRNFGGVGGLKRSNAKKKKTDTVQEFYNGLRLRIDIILTHKPNTYEMVLSINDIPWSRKTIRRKTAQTTLQPYLQTPGISNANQNIRLFIHHYTTALDKAFVANPSDNDEHIFESKIETPWKVGMRLEAKDRKNPSILAVANIIEVYEDNRIRINFDGWTSTYDYTVETDNPDLHPCGYWEYIQRVLYKNINVTNGHSHLTFNRFDKPKSYNGAFSWRNYLTEKNEQPVPYECFNYLQTEGMPIEYFPHGITKSAFIRLSCRHYHNVRVKYQKMNTIVQNEIANQILFEHRIKSTNATSLTSSGVIMLPASFDTTMLIYPCLKQFQNGTDINLHLTCNHRCYSPLDSNTIVFGCHLIDTKGIALNKSELDMSIISICMMTAIDLARNQKHPIAPSTSQLISDKNGSFSKQTIEVYMRSWLELSAYITCMRSTDFYIQRYGVNITEETPELFHTIYNDQELFAGFKKTCAAISLSDENLLRKPYLEFGKYGECYYCSLLRDDESKVKTSDISFQQRITAIGDYAASIFYFEMRKPKKNPLQNRLLFNDEFFVKFNALEYIDADNVVIDRFQLSHKNGDALRNLTFLSLENNDLITIDVEFRSLKKLSHIKLSQNPLESLPIDLFTPRSLQSVELNELGQLIDINPNSRFSSDLKTLTITNSIFSTLPLTLCADGRSKLTKLVLNGVPWWGIDGMSVNEVVQYESFMNKFIPYLSKDELSAIYQMYDEDLNGVLSYSEINLMNAHIYRFLPRLRQTQTKIPGSGRSSVEPSSTNDLDASKQESFLLDTSGFPSSIFQLEQLTSLTLQYQAIKTVPDAIKQLRYLSELNLSHCIELETISPEVGLLPLKELNLTGCVSLKTPPAEIIRRGLTQTMAFLQRLIGGSTTCKRTKLMLVGLGGAGKTSLVRAFLASHSDSTPEVTDGIDILKWKVPLGEPDDVLEFSVWDFAGQSVYYHTHQFFLAKKAVYVLAWNIRLGAEHAGLDFWLSSICCHAPNAPIFVVGTHMDQVSRIDLRQDDLKRRYPQISEFINVSTYTGENVDSLIENIIRTTLALPYMDEQIPKAWLNFENIITTRKEDILEYKEVEEIAHDAGIFEPDEVLQSVQFLHDLGSLQYFASEQLKNYVVINPQWIVNVMACIVSIKDSPVKDGRLNYSDIGIIWKDYQEELHPWILKLTEAFDLTFPVPDQNMNLVPCLLPEEEPEYTWNEDDTDPEHRELKVVYTFNYLPAGLFNRAQVRLFQFSDKSTIWRYGSLLVKNNHRAVIIRSDDRHIDIKIQGVRPDNILFLIHEVFEGLVNESFFGVTYDIAFPCPDCVELGTNEPWQFSSSLINRAIELKSPSIQCHRFFHVASVTDLQALVPPDSKSNYDLHLEYSVRDLKSYKQNVAVDIVYLYPAEHIPTANQIETKVDPRKINDDLTKRGLKIWSPDSMKEFKIENHYLVIKEAKSILFGISTELLQNTENRNLCDALQTILNILRKPIIPILFGTDSKWKESDIGVVLSDKLYVNMQNPKRYDNRILELVDLIEQENESNSKSKQQLRDEPTDVFISYCWANSHDAVHKGTKPTATSIGWADPRSLKDYLEGRGLSVWMDITRLGNSGVLHEIVQGLKNTRLVIACVSDEYTQSEVCRNEFLFAKNTLRLPVILAVFGNGDKWRTTEVGMCSLTCQQINFQFENPTAFEDIFVLIQNDLPKRNTSMKDVSNAKSTAETAQKTTEAYHELFELTQRKFLRLTAGFAEAMTTRAYPRLFAVDFIREKEKSAQELLRIEIVNQMNSQHAQQADNKEDNARDKEAERQRDKEVRETERQTQSQDQPPPEKVKKLCIRALCENEENWHASGSPFEITDKAILQNSVSYLTRIMLLLKQSDLALEILTTDEGEAELRKLDELASSMNMEVKESYGHLRRWIMDCDTEEKLTGLKQCLMPSGKVLWLCEEHQNQPRITLVTGSVTGGYTRPQAEEKSEIVKALAKINSRIANNELPGPSVRVPAAESTRRGSSDRQQSHRYSRQESTSIKTQANNLREIDESKQEEDDADYNERISNTKENSNQDEETEMTTTNCSIM